MCSIPMILRKRAAQVWEFILDQIVTCESPKDIPMLEDIRNMVKILACSKMTI